MSVFAPLDNRIPSFVSFPSPSFSPLFIYICFLEISFPLKPEPVFMCNPIEESLSNTLYCNSQCGILNTFHIIIQHVTHTHTHTHTHTDTRNKFLEQNTRQCSDFCLPSLFFPFHFAPSLLKLHADVWQKPSQYYKIIILQLKIKLN